MASSVDSRSHAGAVSLGDRQQEATEQHKREYCHLIRDVAEDLRMYGSSCAPSRCFFYFFVPSRF
jgi:hypothetical protein